MGINFVLIHGSWCDGSFWNDTVKHLEKLGHTAHAPTLAGHGKGADKSVSQQDCVDSAIKYVVDNNLRDVVVVGHSWGGTILQGLAENIPDRLRRLVFLNAFVLLDGQCLEENTPAHYQALFPQLTTPDGGCGVPPFPIVREAFIGDADLELAQKCFAMLSPTPRRSHTDKMSLKNFFSLQIPKSYVNCTEDIGLPPGDWHPKMSSRLGLYRLVQLPGSHLIMNTNPALLATKLVEAGRD